ncbi:MAG: hypothetical protein WBV94_08405 [Blastocatellia bacterium]
MKKYLLIIGAIIFLGTAAHAATVCFPFQGCTGTSTAPTAGQVLIGNSSSTYSPAYLTAGSNVTISTSSGAITISASGSGGGGSSATTTINGVNGPTFSFTTSTDSNIQLSISTSTGTLTFNPGWSGILGATRGGTDNDEYVAGDLLYADGINHLARLAVGGDGQFLQSGGGFPSWQNLPVISPGGLNTQIQFNDGGVFGGNSNFYYDKSSTSLFVPFIRGATATDSGDQYQGSRIVNTNGSGTFGDQAIGGDLELSSGGVTIATTTDYSTNARAGQINLLANELVVNNSTQASGAGLQLTGGLWNGSVFSGGLAALSSGSTNDIGDAGPVYILGGNGGSTSGAGGSVNITAGNAQGGDSNGGSITIQSGINSGGGTNGYVQIITSRIFGDTLNPFLRLSDSIGTQLGYGDTSILLGGSSLGIIINGSNKASFDTSGLSADRTFSFPDHPGKFVVSTSTPATASTPCSPGQTSYDSSFFYVCTATDTWKRSALSTF